MSRWWPDICLLAGIAMTAAGYLLTRAVRRANRVIARAPFVQSRHCTVVVPEQVRHG